MTEIAPGGFSLADLRGQELVWICEFTWAGETLYLSRSRETDVPAGPDGADVECFDGLEWGEEQPDDLSLLQDTLESKRASLTLHLYPELDVPARISEGHNLATATGRLRLWPRGTTTVLDVIEGDMMDPTWDLPETPIVVTLEEDPVQDRSLWPASNAKVDADSWANHDPAIEGEFYPWVFGGPGTTTTTDTWTPGLIVDTASAPMKILIAGHACPLASNVDVVNVTQGTQAVRAVQHMQDGHGRMIAYVEPALGWLAAGDEVWINWYSGGARAWGHVSPFDGSEPLRGAGDLLIWWLRQSTVRFDAGRLAAVRARLNEYKIDTYVVADPGSRISPYHWVQDNLLPILPVSPRIGPRGLYFVVWDLKSTAEDARVHLKEGLNCERAGPVTTTSRNEVATEVTVSYHHDPREGEPTARLVLTGDDVTLDQDADARRSFQARRAWLQQRTNICYELAAPHVQDASTAGLIAATEIRRRGLQWDLLSYDVDQEIAGQLDPGDVVALTDVGRSINNRPCLVVSRPWLSDGRMPVGLQGHMGVLGGVV